MTLSSLYQKIFIALLALGIVILGFFIIKPLLTSILLAIILAYVFYPVYQFLIKKFQRGENEYPQIAAFLVIFLIIILILVPILILLSMLSLNLKNISYFFHAILKLVPTISDQIILLLGKFGISKDVIDLNMKNALEGIFSFVITGIQSLFLQIPEFLFNFFITLFILYYLLIETKNILPIIHQNLFMKSKHLNHIIQKFDGLMQGMILSQILIAIIQSILVAISCIILGLPNIILLSLLAFVMAFVPFIGVLAVWIGILFYLIFGVTDFILWKPIFMIIYGVLIISMVDNFVRPLILSNKAGMNPALVLIGFIGGLSLFGLPGMFIGPLVLIIMESIIKILFNEPIPK